MANRRFARAAVLGCGLLLAACSSTPSYPLMTPIQVAKNFGYFDQPIDDTHWVVSYVTPRQAGYGYRFDQSPAEAQAKGLAMDMALWHASQVAEAHGYAGFSVTDRRSSTDAVNVEDFYSDPYWYGGWGWRHGWGGGGWGGGGWGWGGWGWGGGPWGGPWGADWYNDQHSTLQVEAKLVIALTQAPKTGEYRADDTINRLRTAYPEAEGAPAAAPGAPPPAEPAGPPAAKPTA